MAAGNSELLRFLLERNIHEEEAVEICSDSLKIGSESDDSEERTELRCENIKLRLAQRGMPYDGIRRAVLLIHEHNIRMLARRRFVLLLAAALTTALATLAVFLQVTVSRKVAVLRLAHSEVALQEQRSKELVATLSGAVRENQRDIVAGLREKYDKARSDAEKSAILAEIGRLSESEAFLKLLDEISGSRNRLTIARRRYAAVWENTVNRSGFPESLFLKWHDLPPAPGATGEVLPNGH